MPEHQTPHPQNPEPPDTGVEPQNEDGPEAEFSFSTARIDQRDIRNQAYEHADEALQREQAEMLEGKGMKKLAGRIHNVWRQTITRTARRQNLMRDAEAELINAQSIHARELGDPEAARETQQHDMEALIARTTEGYLRSGEGEEVTESSNPAVEAKVKEFIRIYADDDAAFDQLEPALEGVRQAMQETHTDTIAGFSVEQLVELAANVKEKVTTERTLDDMLGQIQFYEAQVRAGVRTELQRTKVEKILDWADQHPRLVISAKTAALAVTAAAVLSKGFTSAAGKIAGTVVPGTVGATMASIHEAKALKGEKRHLERASAKGKPVASEGQERRQELAGSLYEKVSASSLVDRMSRLTEGAPEDLDAAQTRTLLNIVAEITMRERLSLEKGTDLISFSSARDVETERFDLARLRAKAAHYAGERMPLLTQAERAATGIGTHRNVGEFVEAWIDQSISSDQITDGIEAKDKIYRKIRNGRVSKAMVKGALTGVTLGLIAQETAGTARSDYQGITDGALAASPAMAENQTFLRNLLDGSGVWDGPDVHSSSTGITGEGEQASDQTGAAPPPAAVKPQEFDHSRPWFQDHAYDGNDHFERIHEGEGIGISNGFRLVHEIQGQDSNAGYLSLKDSYGNSFVEGLAQGPQGLTPDSIDKLHSYGIETHFNPAGDGGRGRLDIIVPPEMNVNAPETVPEAPESKASSEPHQPSGFDSNPRAKDYIPPAIASPTPTGRRELERRPTTASTTASVATDAPAPEASTPSPETGATSDRWWEGLNLNVPERPPAGAEVEPDTEVEPEPAPEAEALVEPEPEPAVEPEEPPVVEPDPDVEPEPEPEPAVPEREPQSDYAEQRRQITSASGRGLHDLLQLAERFNADGLVSYSSSSTEPTSVEPAADKNWTDTYIDFVEHLASSIQRVEKAEFNTKADNYATQLAEATTHAELRAIVDDMVDSDIARIENADEGENYNVEIINDKMSGGKREQLETIIRRTQEAIAGAS
ncbi:MAG TPA: hypothetical protein VF272_03865 [Candidatus Saccharimonadia bacterium]